VLEITNEKICYLSCGLFSVFVTDVLRPLVFLSLEKVGILFSCLYLVVFPSITVFYCLNVQIRSLDMIPKDVLFVLCRIRYSFICVNFAANGPVGKRIRRWIVFSALNISKNLTNPF